MNFQFTHVNAKQTSKKLKDFRGSVQRRINGSALNFAATPMLNAARSKASKETGALKRSLIKVSRKYHQAGVVMTLVGIDTAAEAIKDGKLRRPVKYAHLVEYGTAHHSARPFIRPAFASTKHIAKNRFFSKLKTAVKKEIDRLAAKGVKP